MDLLPFISLAVLILSIILHEISHGYAANTLGDPTARLAGRLTLNPLPHIDPLGSVLIPAFLVFTGSSILFGWAKPVPYNPHNLAPYRWAEGVVAFAGSGTNLLLALIFGLMVRFGAGTLPEPALALATIISFTNLFLGLFNLIPFPPLDGFTVLKSFLPWNISARLEEFYHKIHALGPGGLILFLLLFSFVLVEPFFIFVRWLFMLIVGG